jgi:hypothetical protein
MIVRISILAFADTIYWNIFHFSDFYYDKQHFSRLNFFFPVTNSVLPAISGPAIRQTSQDIT